MKKLLVMLALFLAFCPQANAKTTVHFADVGQGDCTIIQSSGEMLMIDTGPSEAHETLAKDLKALGVKHIDTLILTHPHDDHDGNFDYLVDNYLIDTLYMPEYADDEEDYGDLLRRATGAGTRIRYPSVGDQIKVGDATATILSAADPAQYPDDKNLWSIVTRIDDGNTSIIVMGDAEDINEYAMIDAGLDLNADILRVGHHGSNTSTSGAFLNVVTPNVALISCGAGNQYGHPNQETLDALQERGIEIYRTDLNGTIMISISGDGYKIAMDK